MAPSLFFLSSFSCRKHLTDSLRGLFLVPASLAFTTSLLIIIYISSTSKLIIHTHHIHHLHLKPPLDQYFSTISPPLPTASITRISLQNSVENSSPDSPQLAEISETPPLLANISGSPESQWSKGLFQMSLNDNTVEDNMNNKEVFHDREIFLENYKEMNRTLKIYVYPHSRKDPFANVLLPVDYEPGGNYASESYFKKALMNSHFITMDPSQADLFYLPFSIAELRNDKRVGVDGLQDFIKDYISSISKKYPYWNRTGGADHFYVACHSIGRSAMDKVVEVKINAIQMVCSSSYFLQGYVAHKDASVPQIWPRNGDPPTRPPSERKKLAFFAGEMNSRVRQHLLQQWRNDPEICVHSGRLKTPYSEALLGSKYCIHAKGFEVNTARIGDALYYGCVPIILADHYDLPYADILNWKSFSVVVSAVDIPLVKKIIGEISFDEYLRLQRNVLEVQKHFQWHSFPVDYDAFYMSMYELWLRRSCLRIPL